LNEIKEFYETVENFMENENITTTVLDTVRMLLNALPDKYLLLTVNTKNNNTEKVIK
jgi:hypothetical protein